MLLGGGVLERGVLLVGKRLGGGVVYFIQFVLQRYYPLVRSGEYKYFLTFRGRIAFFRVFLDAVFFDFFLHLLESPGDFAYTKFSLKKPDFLVWHLWGNWLILRFTVLYVLPYSICTFMWMRTYEI